MRSGETSLCAVEVTDRARMKENRIAVRTVIRHQRNQWTRLASPPLHLLYSSNTYRNCSVLKEKMQLRLSCPLKRTMPRDGRGLLGARQKLRGLGVTRQASRTKWSYDARARLFCAMTVSVVPTTRRRPAIPGVVVGVRRDLLSERSRDDSVEKRGRREKLDT